MNFEIHVTRELDVDSRRKVDLISHDSLISVNFLYVYSCEKREMFTMNLLSLLRCRNITARFLEVTKFFNW